MSPNRCARSSPGRTTGTRAALFERGAVQDLADGVLRELTRLGVTKPMRFHPGANAEA